MKDWHDQKYMGAVEMSATQFVSRTSHLILWLSVIFITAMITWASLASIEEVTRGIGRVIPSGQTQKVQNLEGGILSEILVKSGDQVQQGDRLLRIDDTQFAATFRENQLQIVALRAKIARLTAESNSESFSPPEELSTQHPQIVANELALYLSRKAELETSIAILTEEKRQRQQEISELSVENRMLKRSLELTNQELDMKKPLVEKGVLPRVEILDIEKDATTLDGRLQRNEQSIPRIKGALNEIEKRIEERRVNYRSSALAELNDSKLALSRLEEAASALADRVDRTEVVAPVTGTVKQVLVNTIGGVVQPGMDLVEIVPSEDSLVVEAEVTPRDIAFLRPGQMAVVKLTAYDFAIYGGLEAELERISADTITTEQGNRVYMIRLRTNKTYLGTKENSLPIIPGMAAEVDILTGNKTVMDYLLKPLKRAQERALRER